jgi:hypothetical protein
MRQAQAERTRRIDTRGHKRRERDLRIDDEIFGGGAARSEFALVNIMRQFVESYLPSAHRHDDLLPIVIAGNEALRVGTGIVDRRNQSVSIRARAAGGGIRRRSICKA